MGLLKPPPKLFWFSVCKGGEAGQLVGAGPSGPLAVGGWELVVGMGVMGAVLAMGGVLAWVRAVDG